MCIVNVKRKVSQQQNSHFCRIIVIVSISTMHNCTYMFLAFSPLACKTHIFLSRLSYPPSVCYTLMPGVLDACPQHLSSVWSSQQLQWSVFSLCKHSRLQWTRKSFVKRSGRTFVIGKMPRKGKWTIKVSVKNLRAICTSSLLPPTDRPVLFFARQLRKGNALMPGHLYFQAFIIWFSESWICRIYKFLKNFIL